MIRATLCVLAAAATLAAADKPSREVQELQRDVAQLQDMVKAMQQALEARLTAMSGQIDSVGAAAAQVNANAGALQKAIAQVAQDQERKIVPAIAEQGTRLDQFGSTIATMQQAIGDLTTAVNRVQTQLVDVANIVRAMQSPAAPPKPPAADLLKSAQADRLGSKYELAVQEYSDFLKYYSDTAEADTALFELGMTHMDMKDFNAALRDFDTFAAQRKDSKRLPEVLFYRAKSLELLNRGVESRAACQDLRKRFPSNDLAKQCPVARQ
jgi:TolA-binding protein